MADKVYYECEGELLLPLKVKISFTVRTEDGSTPEKAALKFLKTGDLEHKDGDIEDISLERVEIKGCFDGSLDEHGFESIVGQLLEDGQISLTRSSFPLSKPKLEVIDAK